MLKKPSTKLILLALMLSIYCLLVSHKILILGKHGDGVEYATVARNLAEGRGTFWSLYLDDTRHPIWREHPPLVFWIQGLFIKVFGDGPYVEGVYGFMIGIVILLLTALFWQHVRHDFQLTLAGSWWPVFLLISLPTFAYYMQTNRLVITFMIIALLATLAAYRSVLAGCSTVLYALLCGLLIYLGFIAKGPVAFFPLAVPAIAWVTLRAKFSRVIISTVIATVVFSLAMLATFYFYPESQTFWKGFWHAQVMASLKSLRAPQDSYWYYADRLSREMAVLFSVICVLMLITRAHPRHIRFSRQAGFFLLIALAGCLPFFFSKRQKLRYLLQSYPFFILGMAFLTNRVALKIEGILVEKRKFRQAVVIAGLLFFTIATTTMLYRKDYVKKRAAFYQDFYLKNYQFPERSTISICPPERIDDDWVFTIDMQRFYKVSLTANMGHDYLIIDKNSNCKVPDEYQKVHQQQTIKYVLYKRISSK